MAHVYVYYRIVGDTRRARAAVAALFERLEALTGVSGRVLRRCDDPQTWMEVYEPVGDVRAFRVALDREVATADLGRHAEGGERHVECFTAIDAGGADGER